MKLIRAEFTNFRLLKEVSIEFSISVDKPITVIRAANESGKTTMLTALQWCLFGDDALPHGSGDYRMAPLDVTPQPGRPVETTVSIDFQRAEDRHGREQRYRLSRTAVDDGRKRGPSLPSLYQLTDAGAREIDNPDAWLRPELPSELREVFFTDGDRALSFIEGDESAQAARVEGAIRSMLGIEIVEEAEKHVSNTVRELNKELKSDGESGQRLKIVTEALDKLAKTIPELEEQLRSVTQERGAMLELFKAAEQRLEDVLRRGNRDELANQLKAATARAAELRSKQASLDVEHAELLRSQSLGVGLFAAKLLVAAQILERKKEAGKIPNQTIPVLEERLHSGVCICGESLSPESPDSARRREHIQHLIARSEESDRYQGVATDLYYSSRELLRGRGTDSWVPDIRRNFQAKSATAESIEKNGRRQAELEAKLDQIPDLDTKALREERDTYRRNREKLIEREAKLQAAIKQYAAQRVLYEKQRQKGLSQDKKGRRVQANFTVAGDVLHVLKTAMDRMKQDELSRVSAMMNGLFLQMIGSDDEQRSIIQKAEVCRDFRIRVHGVGGHRLDPQRDLNGASRRALTIAFILALANVSEFPAPNVIDTPLGMMSGYVKRSVLQLAAEKSTQLILFLTHSEIAGCEDILDKYAGAVCTLTNPAHFPAILANEPEVSDRRILTCRCSHRQSCSLCQRRETPADLELVH